jgi:hypothetical protein
VTRNARLDPMPYRWPLRPGGRPDALPGGDIMDPLADITRLIDDAHRALSSEDLAGLLVATRALTATLAEGRPPPRPVDRLDEGRPGLSSAARVYLRPVSVFLHLSTRRSGPAEAPALVSLGARLDDYLDEVAARPKGCAVPR